MVLGAWRKNNLCYSPLNTRYLLIILKEEIIGKINIKKIITIKKKTQTLLSSHSPERDVATAIATPETNSPSPLATVSCVLNLLYVGLISTLSS
jgi:hypothetical protein